MTELVLAIPGQPCGKGRPRFAKGRAYTPAETVSAERLIQDEWRHAGCPRLQDVALKMHLLLVLERPKGHFKRDGSLSAEGSRHVLPVRKPDCDNALKLVLDALNTLAFRDDVQVVDVTVSRRWGPHAQTVIRLWETA
jgi:Holliday junction resolvase RusA-like endonuclease